MGECRRGGNRRIDLEVVKPTAGRREEGRGIEPSEGKIQGKGVLRSGDEE